MRVKDELYFAPKVKFEDINWGDKGKLIEAFEDRIKGFYLDPIKLLLCANHPFAAGVICITTIDCLGRLNYGKDEKKRVKKWAENYLTEFKNNPENAEIFNNDFRNGLVHEGRIKNGSYFSFEIKKIVFDGKSIGVNPKYLYGTIKTYFNEYIDKINKENKAFKNFKEMLNNDFSIESNMYK